MSGLHSITGRSASPCQPAMLLVWRSRFGVNESSGRTAWLACRSVLEPRRVTSLYDLRHVDCVHTTVWLETWATKIPDEPSRART